MVRCVELPLDIHNSKNFNFFKIGNQDFMSFFHQRFQIEVQQIEGTLQALIESVKNQFRMKEILEKQQTELHLSYSNNKNKFKC
jgi:hypothetical protein